MQSHTGSAEQARPAVVPADICHSADVDQPAADVCPPTFEALSQALARETDGRRRAECLADIQSYSVQLALDLLVREPDITGFFRAFTRTLVEESESHAGGVWLLDADGSHCDLW